MGDSDNIILPKRKLRAQRNEHESTSGEVNSIKTFSHDEVARQFFSRKMEEELDVLRTDRFSQLSLLQSPTTLDKEDQDQKLQDWLDGLNNACQSNAASQSKSAMSSVKNVAYAFRVGSLGHGRNASKRDKEPLGQFGIDEDEYPPIPTITLADDDKPVECETSSKVQTRPESVAVRAKTSQKASTDGLHVRKDRRKKSIPSPAVETQPAAPETKSSLAKPKTSTDRSSVDGNKVKKIKKQLTK